MHPLELYEGFKQEAKFPLHNAGRQDYIRGSLLTLSALLLLGLPTFIGYFIFTLRAQTRGASFLPPIEPETIGDYTYLGFKYLLFIGTASIILMGYVWGIIQLSILTETIRGIILIASIFVVLYVAPITIVLYAQTGIPVPRTIDEARDVVQKMLTFEYSTFFLFFLLATMLFSLLFSLVSLFLITIPIVLVGVWYLGLVFVRVLGYSTLE